MSYQLLLTNAGATKIATASNNNGKPVKITEFVVGQGVDVDFSKRLDKQTLVAKRYQGKVESVNLVAPNKYEIVCVVPVDVGGFTIREFGLIDSDGVLVWVGSLPEVQKPTADSLSAVDYRLKAVVQIDNPAVSIVVDTNAVTATQSWVNANFVSKPQFASFLELLFPLGYAYWSSVNENPKAKFDLLFGYETFWQRLEGIELVAVRDGDSNIGLPRKTAGREHIGNTYNTNKPDGYPLYPLYLWIRYQPVKYDGLTRADGTTQYL